MIHSKKYTDAARGKVSVQSALIEAERDDVGKCATCTELALENEKYCTYCKDYWADVENGMFEDWDW